MENGQSMNNSRVRFGRISTHTRKENIIRRLLRVLYSPSAVRRDDEPDIKLVYDAQLNLGHSKIKRLNCIQSQLTTTTFAHASELVPSTKCGCCQSSTEQKKKNRKIKFIAVAMDEQEHQSVVEVDTDTE